MSKRKQIISFLLGSYAGLVLMVLGSIILEPSLLLRYPQQAGLSEYGNHLPAAIPYIVGMGFSAYCLARAAWLLPYRPKRLGWLRLILLCHAVLIIGLVLTPNLVNDLFYYVHMLLAVALFMLTFFAASWAVKQRGRTSVDWFLYALLLGGIIGSLLSVEYVDVLGILPWTQIAVFSGSFFIIIRATSRWLPTR